MIKKTKKALHRPTTVVVSGYFNPLHVGHLEMFREAKKLGDKFLESVAYGDLGQVHQALGHYPEAIQNYTLAIDLQTRLEIKYYLCFYLVLRARLYYKLKQYGLAREDAASGKAIAEEIGREEVIFKARLLETLLKAEATQSEAESALTDLLAESQDGKRKFEILYHLHRITAQPGFKDQARTLLKSVNRETWPYDLRLKA